MLKSRVSSSLLVSARWFCRDSELATQSVLAITCGEFEEVANATFDVRAKMHESLLARIDDSNVDESAYRCGSR
jgi:hypothetical protein